MTLAPVIGGSERQGFGKYSLCSEKKEQIERPSRRNPSPNERKIHENKSPLLLTIQSMSHENGNLIYIIS